MRRQRYGWRMHDGRPRLDGVLYSDAALADPDLPSYAAANRDGRPRAELEMESLLRAMAARVGRIEVGEPALAPTDVLRGYGSFRAAFHAC